MPTNLSLESPTKLRITSTEPEEQLKLYLQYRDKRIDFELQKHKNSTWFINNNGREAYEEKLQSLKDDRTKCLLFKDNQGLWTYSGLIQSLAIKLQVPSWNNLIKYPESHSIPWAEKPFEMYPYQAEACQKLLEAKHASVEMATGLGKSLIITYILKALGLKTVIMAPSTNIARQLFEGEDGKGGLKAAFGAKYVGLYGDGRKDCDKLFTVGIAASLTKIKEDSLAWKCLSGSQVFIADESHLCPASTLAKVCFGLMAQSPYRFFLSATQMRNDGLDMLLNAITGPIVYQMSINQGISKGYLANLNFTMVQVPSSEYFESWDALEMTRKHLFYNPKVNAAAGSIINSFVEKCGYQVLVLIDEIKQFEKLIPHLRHRYDFAHGGTTDLAALPKKYQRPNPSALVHEFNKGNLPILIGTSCISTGTDIKANRATINLRGGRSEIDVMQGPIGRSTRLHKLVGKESCEIIDFDVSNVQITHRHAEARKAIYESIAPCQNWQL